MSLDEALRAVVEETVRATLDRELSARLSDGVTITAPPDDRPLSSDDLKARGYSTDETYALLRAHGVRLPGGRRMRIARAVLEQVERGELTPNPIATSPRNPHVSKQAERRASAPRAS